MLAGGGFVPPTFGLCALFTKEKEQFELRVTHQKFVKEHLFEEFVKVYMHPNRIQKLLDMGYSIDELDDVL
jgi:hypothetical protein